MAPRVRIPEPEGLNAEFYRRARDGALHLQRCAACGRVRHPPRHACAACGATDSEWTPSSGRGKLFSWVVTHYPFDRGWAEETPYVTAIVELEEGVRVVGALDMAGAPGLEIGAPVELTVTPMGDDFAFLAFHAAGGSDERN